MIPHIRASSSFQVPGSCSESGSELVLRGWWFRVRVRLRFCGRTFLALGPALDVRLAAARDAESARGYVMRNRRAGGDVGAAADGHRCDQLRVAADERAVANDGLVFLVPVVIAG